MNRRSINIYDDPTPGPSSQRSSSQRSLEGRSAGTRARRDPQPVTSSSVSAISSATTGIEAVRDLVYALLILHQTKVPFRRIDMARMLGEKKIPDALITAAGKHLKRVFGYRLVHVRA